MRPSAPDLCNRALPCCREPCRDLHHSSCSVPSSAFWWQPASPTRAACSLGSCAPPPQQSRSRLHAFCDKRCTGQCIKPAFLHAVGAGFLHNMRHLRAPAAFLVSECGETVSRVHEKRKNRALGAQIRASCRSAQGPATRVYRPERGNVARVRYTVEAPLRCRP